MRNLHGVCGDIGFAIYCYDFNPLIICFESPIAPVRSVLDSDRDDELFGFGWSV